MKKHPQKGAVVRRLLTAEQATVILGESVANEAFLPPFDARTNVMIVIKDNAIQHVRVEVTVD